MAIHNLPHFGKIDSDLLEEYYEVELDFNGNKVQVDLNFEDESIDPKFLDEIKVFIGDIQKIEKKNRKYIEDDYEDDEGEVKEYLTHHLAELEPEDLEELIDVKNKTIPLDKQLLKKLQLVRIGIFPNGSFDADNFATFDYSIGEELTDYLIVVGTDEFGNFESISMES